MAAPSTTSTGRIAGELAAKCALLGTSLAWWDRRDDSRAEPGIRQHANVAMNQVDAMLADLHALRSRLTGEMRASDDATAARVDALLAARGR